LIGVKVAVIDNDTSVLEAMQSLLERWTCEVCLLRDLADVDMLIEAKTFRPDIILADYHLDGGACGLTAVEGLRAATSDPALPAIVVTADHSREIADKARAGGCEILLKPVKPAELRALMLHLVSSAANAPA
jgi:CheY-like chemotaxis protein